MDIRQFARAMDLGVRGEDLLDEGRSRPRHADDENRPRIGIAPATPVVEKFGSERRDRPVDEPGMQVGVVVPAFGGPDGRLKFVGDLEAGGGPLIETACVQDRTQAEMEPARTAGDKYLWLSNPSIAWTSASGNRPLRFRASRQ